MIPSSVRIFACTQPVDMRRSFDGLALTAQQFLAQDPRSGALFVFCNKRANRLKVLWFDHNGYCILYKRLHRALFRIPPPDDNHGPAVVIDGKQLAGILRGEARTSRRKNAE